MIIGIDPGHGGRDPGAIGPGGTREADINLAIALCLAGKLDSLRTPAGKRVTPVLSRERDVFVSLADRVNLLNRFRCALVLSLHINAAVRNEPRYISAFICGRGGRAETAAGRLLRAVVQATGWPNGGVRTSPFYILRKTTAPAVLLEMGFISNPEQERELLRTEVQDRLAGAISMEIAKLVSVIV